jgi:hypothetical protein
MRKAKDRDILRLFEELTDATGSTHPRAELLGGSHQASAALAELAKTDPRRLVQITEQMSPGRSRLTRWWKLALG